MSTDIGPKGPLLRLSGLNTADLPSPTASADELRPFLATLLEEAIPFLDSVPTGTSDASNDKSSSSSSSPSPWKSKGTKKFPESGNAPIATTERVLSLTVDGHTETETWACRRSVHVDAAQRGTASWAEFVECLRDRHAETEEAFTPTVLGHRVVASWPGAQGVGAISLTTGGRSGSGSGSGSGSSWGRFEVAVVEMKHKIPPPLKPRVFGVLQVACTAMARSTSTATEGEEGDEFVVISVPVKDLATGSLKDKAGLSLEKGVVIGAYAAVERVRRLRGGHDGGGSEGKMEVEWVMATASDAKGVLPMWVQVKAVPGQVAKDVKLFLGWVDGEREKGTLKGVGAAAQG